MGKKLMVLLAGAASLAAVVYVAAPCPAAFGVGVAPSLHCGSRPCDYSLSSSPFSLRFGQASVLCEAARGSGRFTTATTSPLRLTFRDCREQNTPFKFTCVSSRGLAPPIRSEDMSATLMEEEGGADTLQLAPLRVTLVCGGGQRWILEGFFEADIEPRHCGRRKKSYALRTELIAHGGDGPTTLYDVLVDGNAHGNWQFDAPWLLSFPERASIRC
jgi:hypothetical protein